MSATIISVQCKNRYSASPKFINGTWIFSIHESLPQFETLRREMGGQAWPVFTFGVNTRVFPDRAEDGNWRKHSCGKGERVQVFLI